MYFEEQHYKALALHDECGSVTKTTTQLGCPTGRQTVPEYDKLTFLNASAQLQ